MGRMLKADAEQCDRLCHLGMVTLERSIQEMNDYQAVVELPGGVSIYGPTCSTAKETVEAVLRAFPNGRR